MSRIDHFLSNRNLTLIVMACVLFSAGYSFSLQVHSAREEYNAQVAARVKMAADEAARKHVAFVSHLRREEWDRAHPEVVAKRKAEAAVRAKEQARVEAAQQAAQQQAAAQAETEKRRQEAEASRLAHACDTALDYEKQAMRDVDAGSYQDAYENANSGLKYNDSCDNDTQQGINKGYLLSARGFAEHHLSVGDSRTDLNQANALLVQCQTAPGVYGTAAGAGCETQEQNNIRAQTDWDLESD